MPEDTQGALGDVTDTHGRTTEADPDAGLRLPDDDPVLFRHRDPDTLRTTEAPQISVDLPGDETSAAVVGFRTPGTAERIDGVDSPDSIIDLAVNGSVHATQWATSPPPMPRAKPVENLKVHRWPARAMKRTLDLAIGLPLLLLALPMIGACMLLIFVTSPGPALFRQERIGRNRRPFSIIKLRTMRVDAEEMLQTDADLAKKHVEHGFKLPAGEDPRITRVGRLLRKTSLDELPQLAHVISGEMSLVGPRPLVKPEVARLYGTDADLFLSVKPGITGMWQVNGRSGVAGNKRAALEKRYLRHWSVKRDVGIIVKTIPAVVTASGAH